MAEFKVHTIETAGDSVPLLEKSVKSFGFIPNLHGVMAESPAMLEAYQTMHAIFGKTNLSETERQIILMVNNRLNTCTYCMAAHTMISKMAKVPDDVIESLRSGTPIADPKLQALRVFAEKINISRGWPEDSDLDALFAHGYTKETVLDVILGTSFKVLSNFTNHIADTPVDEAFAAYQWSLEESV